MSEQIGSVTHKKSSDFHGGIRVQSSFTIRWELEDKIDIICLDDSLKYRIYGSQRVLCTGLKPSALADNPLDLHNSSYHTQPRANTVKIPSACTKNLRSIIPN